MRWHDAGLPGGIAMDLLYVGLGVLSFGLSWALVKLCERL